MLWCQGAQNIGLSNTKLKSALTWAVWSQCTPVPNGQTDRQTDEHHGNSALKTYHSEPKIDWARAERGVGSRSVTAPQTYFCQSPSRDVEGDRNRFERQQRL